MMEYKNTGAVYEVRTYGSVRGMGHKASPYSMFWASALAEQNRFRKLIANNNAAKAAAPDILNLLH